MSIIDFVILAVSIVELYIEYINDAQLRYFIKPIPIFLMIYSLLKCKSRMARITNYGLMFSVVGDILLSIKGDLYFRIGTGFFLVAHLLYIVAFRISNNPENKAAGVFAYALCAVVLVGFAFNVNSMW